MSARPCKECGRRPKAPGRHRCDTCQLRHEPIGEQIAAAERRLAMIPEDMRLKRSKKILEHAPAGTTWCAGCQSFRDLADFAKGATKCRPCASAKAHAAMVAKTYGITSDDYAELFRRQGGKCAICRARPKSKRLAVDHDHKTGAVLGLLCSRCNHELKGSAWDSLALATALWHYMNTPPASGAWLPPEVAPRLAPVEDASRRAARPDPMAAVVTRGIGGSAASEAQSADEAACERPHYLLVGAETVPGKSGVYRVYVDAEGGDAPF